MIRNQKKYWTDRGENAPFEGQKGNENWIESYWNSQYSSYKKQLIDILKKLPPFASLLEVGCNCGPNLNLIHKEFPSVKLVGIDINLPSVLEGRKRLKDVDFQVANASNLPCPDKSFDVVLTDAVLLTITPKDFKKVISEFKRVGKKSIIMFEWQSDKEKRISNRYWARDYRKFFKNLSLIKIQNRDGDWIKFGYIIQVTL